MSTDSLDISTNSSTRAEQAVLGLLTSVAKDQRRSERKGLNLSARFSDENANDSKLGGDKDEDYHDPKTLTILTQEFHEELAPLTITLPEHVSEEHNQIPWDEESYEEIPWWDQPDLEEDDELTALCKKVLIKGAEATEDKKGNTQHEIQADRIQFLVIQFALKVKQKIEEHGARWRRAESLKGKQLEAAISDAGVEEAPPPPTTKEEVKKPPNNGDKATTTADDQPTTTEATKVDKTPAAELEKPAAAAGTASAASSVATTSEDDDSSSSSSSSSDDDDSSGAGDVIADPILDTIAGGGGAKSDDEMEHTDVFKQVFDDVEEGTIRTISQDFISNRNGGNGASTDDDDDDEEDLEELNAIIRSSASPMSPLMTKTNSNWNLFEDSNPVSNPAGLSAEEKAKAASVLNLWSFFGGSAKEEKKDAEPLGDDKLKSMLKQSKWSVFANKSDDENSKPEDSSKEATTDAKPSTTNLDTSTASESSLEDGKLKNMLFNSGWSFFGKRKKEEEKKAEKKKEIDAALSKKEEERKERLEKVKQRIEKEASTEELDHQQQQQEDNSQEARMKRAYTCYVTLGKPNKRLLKQKLTGKWSNIEQSDVDLLPWTFTGGMVNVAKLASQISLNDINNTISEEFLKDHASTSSSPPAAVPASEESTKSDVAPTDAEEEAKKKQQELDSSIDAAIEKKRQERKERLEKAKQRIAAEEEEASKEMNAVDESPKARCQRAFEVYQQLGKPNKQTMLEKITADASLKVTKEDLELLPWTRTGSMVNEAKYQTKLITL